MTANMQDIDWLTARAKAEAEGWVYGLRSISAERTSYGGFVWPAFSGEPLRVEATPESVRDTPGAQCGGGIHFLPWGIGDTDLINQDEGAVWQVVRSRTDLAVAIDDQKSKAPWVEVVFEGARGDVIAHLVERGADPASVPWGTATAGDAGTATAGYAGAATAGYAGTATAGYAGTATAGNLGTATAGDAGTATAGYAGTATAGNRGTATAGDAGTATAGDAGTATAGDAGTATAGDAGTATAGEGSTLVIKWWDEEAERYRLAVGYVGEDGIKPNTKYRVEGGKFVEVVS